MSLYACLYTCMCSHTHIFVYIDCDNVKHIFPWKNDRTPILYRLCCLISLFSVFLENVKETKYVISNNYT